MNKYAKYTLRFATPVLLAFVVQRASRAHREREREAFVADEPRASHRRMRELRSPSPDSRAASPLSVRSTAHSVDNRDIYESPTEQARARRRITAEPHHERPMSPLPRPPIGDDAPSVQEPTPRFVPRPVTHADLRRIPPGYDTHYWDPDERPLFLFGKAFDGNSFGKWLYDGTMAVFQPRSFEADRAGEVWLALIRLDGNAARAMEYLGRTGSRSLADLLRRHIGDSRELREDFEDLVADCAKRVRGDEPEEDAFARVFAGRRADRDVDDFLHDCARLAKRFETRCEPAIQDFRRRHAD